MLPEPGAVPWFRRLNFGGAALTAVGLSLAIFLGNILVVGSVRSGSGPAASLKGLIFLAQACILPCPLVVTGLCLGFIARRQNSGRRLGESALAIGAFLAVPQAVGYGYLLVGATAGIMTMW